MQEQHTTPETPFQETPPPAPDQCVPESTERDDMSPVPEKTEETPKEKKKEKTQGRRVISLSEWEEKSALLDAAAEKYLSAMTVDAVIRKHRAMVTQLRDRGMMDADIAEMFGNVYSLDVDAKDVARAMKPKRKRTRKTKDAEENTAENIIAVSPEEAAEKMEVAQ